ncbi:serine protease inhibitor Kazal-type 6-like [Rhineura floridana]|uniref:serine protease inhibitor Kazal-type 6-like n=1 Tax=Rhineura floridana TaxID=261503 RepID=UPI002AC81D57|nr:serine protease inhibitor Kazal-type 6-like [Rhineura floridana]
MKTASVFGLLSLVLFYLFSDVASQHEGQPIDCSEYDNDEAYCTRESNPHCGTDGQTYGNKCAFCKAVLKSDGNLGLQHMGECP